MIKRFEFDFFIAYAREDGEHGARLSTLLSTAGYEVYFAPETTDLGSRWTESIRKAQQESQITVVIVSPHYEKAYWLNEEVLVAIKQMRRDKLRRVIPVYLAPYRNPDDGPHALLQLQGLSLASGFNLLEVVLRLERSLKALQREVSRWEKHFDSRSIAIITGCDYRPETYDRQEAYRVQGRIELAKCPFEESLLRSVVFGDIWFLDHSGLSDHPNVISIGSASVNRLTGIIAEGGKVVKEEGRWWVRRSGNRWAVFGDYARDTRDAVDYFIEDCVDDMLKHAWSNSI